MTDFNDAQEAYKDEKIFRELAEKYDGEERDKWIDAAQQAKEVAEDITARIRYGERKHDLLHLVFFSQFTADRKTETSSKPYFGNFKYQ
jgi:hypothetical protein